jgi:hypothetical protein
MVRFDPGGCTAEQLAFQVTSQLERSTHEKVGSVDSCQIQAIGRVEYENWIIGFMVNGSGSIMGFYMAVSEQDILVNSHSTINRSLSRSSVDS